MSAGILMYRWPDDGGEVEVLLVHPGGPFWARKDLGAWSVAKGEYDDAEDPMAAAIREFAEETGVVVSGDALLPLGEVKQRGGKIVTAWALEGNFDAAELVSNTFEIEWPPKSGRKREFPEVDCAEWFSLAVAREKIIPAQGAFLDRLVALLP